MEHVDRLVGDRAEPAADDQDGALVEHLGGLDDLSLGGEHGRLGQAAVHQLEAHQPVIDPGEGRPGELDQVNVDPLVRESVEQVAQEGDRRDLVERGVDQVDAQDAHRLLLQGRLAVEEADVQHDLRRRRAGLFWNRMPIQPCQLSLRE